MKFARYLEDTQTPEWHKAYINYRLLKKRITAIRRGNGDRSALESPLTTHQNENRGAASQASVVRSMDAPNSLHPTISSTSSQHPLGIETPNASMPALVPPNPSVAEQSERREPFYRSQTLPAQTSVHSRRSDPGRAPSFSRLFSSGNSRGTTRRFTVGPKPHPYSELPLRDLLPLLSPPELAFFSTLDGELDKIESFYVSRENDMRIHTKLLEHQLEELAEHRKLFNAAYPSGAWTSALNTAALLKLKAKLLNEEHTVGAAGSAAKNKGKAAMDRVTGKLAEARASSKNAREQGQNYETDHGMIRLAPDDYYDAKHALKKAVLEHYRGLEMLHNYRILNLTGIRKALKKFQKVTKIAAQNAYMTEKVDKMAFASDTNVRSMMDEMEEIYATRFVNGDKKKALTRLRAGPQHKSHHTSTFWSGLFIGLSVPALVSGIYNSYQKNTRAAIPGWDALLLTYSIFFIPVLFSLLVGLNILVWAHSRINYVFIFEFDLRTRMDHREYFETPSILLAALCYTFWLSFAQIGAPTFSPTVWPVVWLGFAAVIMLDPFPILYKPSRYWLLKSVGKLLTSGTRRVEFSDFWMGDQFCSLVFTLSNLFVVFCVYAEGFNSEWRSCASRSRFWPVAFFLGTLPFLVRLVQSIKRYTDSGLNTHLINGGKYGAGIVSYLCYFIWRHKGSDHGPSFIAWCIFQTIYSFYALAWDLLMDWSILAPDVRYPLLRKELVYNNHIYLYYFAVISNTLIRFIWVLYIPAQGPEMMLRSFIAAGFEMLRRWQWNFYRVENEHVGNVDQYRVTREVPLPYSLDEPRGKDADDDDDDEGSPSRAWFPKQAIRSRKRRAATEV